MANKKRKVKTGRFINNVMKVEDAKDYAKHYYNKHRNNIDRILNERKKETGLYLNQSNEETFTELVTDLYDQNRSKYNNKSNLTAGMKSILDEMQGIDPRINQIKREALYREEAGFEDLRKLNKKIGKQELPYNGPEDDIIGYFDIKDSDYVIVHRKDYTFSTKSPEDVYEYVERNLIGL